MCEVLKIDWEGRKRRALRHPELRNCFCRVESAGDVVKCIWDHITVFQPDLFTIPHTSVEERKLVRLFQENPRLLLQRN